MLTRDKIIGLFCFIDDLLKAINLKEDQRCKVSDSEIVTTGLVSSLYFGGHRDNARLFMKMTGLVPNMLDKSRFNRRLHSLSELIYDLFMQVGHHFKRVSCAQSYVLDSFPVPVCDNIRIGRSKILKGEQWTGKQSSMRRYFYGVKVQLIATQKGIPVEFCFVPGSEHDALALKKLPIELPQGSELFADAAYTNYEIEDLLMETENISLKVSRKSNAKRQDHPATIGVKECRRKIIETTFSQIKGLFLKNIHAVTAQGFFLKITLFIFAFTLNKLIP